MNGCGDIVNFTKNHPLYNYLLIQHPHNAEQAFAHWHAHIGEKYDFDVEHFDEAFIYALPLAEKQNPMQKAAE